MSNLEIEIRLVFTGQEDEPKMLVAQWLRQRGNKFHAVEALTMLFQVPELIQSDCRPIELELAMINTIDYLERQLNKMHRLKQINQESPSSSSSRSLSIDSDDLDIKL